MSAPLQLPSDRDHCRPWEPWSFVGWAATVNRVARSMRFAPCARGTRSAHRLLKQALDILSGTKLRWTSSMATRARIWRSLANAFGSLPTENP